MEFFCFSLKSMLPLNYQKKKWKNCHGIIVALLIGKKRMQRVKSFNKKQFFPESKTISNNWPDIIGYIVDIS